MAVEFQITQNIAGGGLTLRPSTGSGVTRSSATGFPHTEDLSAGQAGTVATSASGALTMAASTHGITTADTVALFWGTTGLRVGATVTAAATDAITLSGGTGDTFPANGTAIVVSEASDSIAVDMGGDTFELVAAKPGQRAAVEFLNSAGAVIDHWNCKGEEVASWLSESWNANPFASTTISEIRAYCGTTTSSTVGLLIGYDASP
jgi:hypothetical protein